MDFCRTTVHVVQQGDTFYKLAQRYKTTVPDIIRRNQGVNPYNLQIGTRLNICAGTGMGNGQMPGQMPEQMPLPEDELELNNDMRKAWLEHAFWTMIYQTSLFNNLEDVDDVAARLMQTPEDIAAVFEKFYSGATINQLTKLLMEHVRLAGEVMLSTRDNNPDTAQLERQWFQNAENIARLLANANSEYSYEEILRMLTRHLDMLKRQMLAALNKEYDNEIRLFDENTNQLMELADYLTEGLLEQFYHS